MRPDIRRQYSEETAEETAQAMSRRERVLKFPDLAELLCRPPLNLTNPLFWSGYIPPRYHQGAPNDSPVRKQLVAICNMVAEREAQLAAGEPPVAPEPITDDQLTKLHACLGDYGISDRNEKLLFLSAEVGRTIASSKEIHKAEAILLIDKIETLIRLEDEHNLGNPANPEDTNHPAHEPHWTDLPHERIADHALTVESEPDREGSAPDPVPDDGPVYPNEEPVSGYGAGGNDQPLY